MVYYLWVILLIIVMMLLWCTTLFALPGNWLILGAAIGFAFLFPASEGRGLDWLSVGVAGGLALFGEIVELLASAAGAKQAGASRRSVVLAIVGTMIGGIAGAIIGVPIPIFGPLIGAVGGGAGGAFAGAYLGEQWKGRDAVQSMAAAKGAMVGRLLGTGGKLLAGAMMIVVIAVDASI